LTFIVLILFFDKTNSCCTNQYTGSEESAERLKESYRLTTEHLLQKIQKQDEELKKRDERLKKLEEAKESYENSSRKQSIKKQGEIGRLFCCLGYTYLFIANSEILAFSRLPAVCLAQLLNW